MLKLVPAFLELDQAAKLHDLHIYAQVPHFPDHV